MLLLTDVVEHFKIINCHLKLFDVVLEHKKDKKI